MKISILMPVYNEASTIEGVVDRILRLPMNLELVIVDDASSDQTPAVLDRLGSPDIKLLHHTVNQGKGAAVRTALKAASGDVIVIQDADLEYDPDDLVNLIVPIEDGRTDVVYGVRSLESQKLVMRLGNRFVTLVANWLYGQQLRDMETCYKMMRRDIALSLDLECRGFDIEAEITSKLLRAGHTIFEMPIRYTARYENKKLSPLDGIPTLRALWKYRKWTGKKQHR